MTVPPTPPRAGWKVRAGLVLASVVVTLAALNLVLGRIVRHPRAIDVSDRGTLAGPGGTRYDYQSIYRDSPDPRLRRELVPNSGNGVVNALGYIGREHPVARTPGTFRIVGIGDSVTMYYGAEGTNYLSVTEQAFAATSDHPRVETLDFGVGGYDTGNEVRLLETKGLAFAPDLVTVGYVLNDAIDFPFTISTVFGRPVADEAQGESLPVLQFVQQRLATVTADRDSFFRRVFDSPLWHGSTEALTKLEQLATAHRFRVLLVAFPVFVDLHPYRLQPVHDALRAQAALHHFDFLDLAPVYAAAGDPGSFCEGSGSARDTIHPNAHGHAIAGRALYEHLAAHPPW